MTRVDRKVGFATGVLGAGAALAVGFVVRTVASVPTPPELVEHRVVALVPPWLFELILQRLVFYAKPLLFAVMLAFELLVGGLVGAVAARRWAGSYTFGGGALLGLGVAAFVLLIGLPALGYGLAGSAHQVGAGPMTLAIVLSGLAYGVVLSGTLRYTASAAATAEPEATADELTELGRSRRLVLTRVAVGLFLLSGGAVAWRFVSDVGNRAFQKPVKGLSPEITPTPDFYTVSKNFLDPTVDAAGWTLDIVGLVDRPLKLSYADLKALPAVDQVHTLACISNPVGGDLIGNATWKGVRLKDLLEQAGVKPNAFKAVFHAADDYTDSVPVAKALEPETLLVYEMNGEPLTVTHGAPARLLIPNIYGMKNVKWLTKIELVDYDFKGYWQKGGWSDVATYQIFSRIDVPASGAHVRPEAATIAGIAFAGSRRISKVEVSTDGGKTWGEAEVKSALERGVWQLWVYDWTPPKDGDYLVRVRATDGTGALQPEEYTDPAPDGATGWHTRAFAVDSSQPSPES